MDEFIEELFAEMALEGAPLLAASAQKQDRPAPIRVDAMDGSYGEALMRAALKECFPDHVFEKTRQLPWMHGLELDCYCEELQLAAEYQGKQHSEFIPFFHDDDPKKFAAQQERDRRKREAVTDECKVLLEVPHTVKYRDIRDFVRTALIELGFDVADKELSYDFMEMARVDGALTATMLAKAREIAISHGGTCVGDVYLGCHMPLAFVCAKGHAFSAPLASVNHRNHKRPRFCPECGGTRKRTWEENARDVARRGYTLLDQFQKTGPDGYTLTYFKVRCSAGHEYEVARDNFIAPRDATAPRKKCIRCERKRTNRDRSVRERRERAEKFGIIPLSDFVGRKDNAEWQCVAKGHRFEASWNTLLFRKQGKCLMCKE